MPTPAGTTDPSLPAQPCWQVFLEAVLRIRHGDRFAPMPEDEGHAHPTVRAMQRGRRHAWLHARYALGWSMFESVRISVRLAETFAAWTRGAPQERGGGLARHLERVENEAREPWTAATELAFVDRLITAVHESRHEDDLELALKSYRAAEEASQRSAGHDPAERLRRMGGAS